MYFIQQLKTQVNTLNILLLLLGLLLFAYRYKRKIAFRVLGIVIPSYLLLVSTSFLPTFLIHSFESKFPPLNISMLDTGRVYHIHVLGAGYNLDEKLPAIAQLELITLGRLTEAIRISKHVSKYKIVTSGYSAFALESQASVAKRAAVSLGIDSTNIITLDTPSSTLEEAFAMKKAVGVKINLILVTDALHMPRAIRIFTDKGYRPIAAPTNFLKKHGANSYQFGWWPSLRNMLLMDKVIHEFLGDIKARFNSEGN